MAGARQIEMRSMSSLLRVSKRTHATSGSSWDAITERLTHKLLDATSDDAAAALAAEPPSSPALVDALVASAAAAPLSGPARERALRDFPVTCARVISRLRDGGALEVASAWEARARAVGAALQALLPTFATESEATHVHQGTVLVALLALHLPGAHSALVDSFFGEAAPAAAASAGGTGAGGSGAAAPVATAAAAAAGVGASRSAAAADLAPGPASAAPRTGPCLAAALVECARLWPGDAVVQYAMLAVGAVACLGPRADTLRERWGGIVGAEAAVCAALSEPGLAGQVVARRTAFSILASVCAHDAVASAAAIAGNALTAVNAALGDSAMADRGDLLAGALHLAAAIVGADPAGVCAAHRTALHGVVERAMETLGRRILAEHSGVQEWGLACLGNIAQGKDDELCELVARDGAAVSMAESALRSPALFACPGVVESAMLLVAYVVDGPAAPVECLRATDAGMVGSALRGLTHPALTGSARARVATLLLLFKLAHCGDTTRMRMVEAGVAAALVSALVDPDAASTPAVMTAGLAVLAHLALDSDGEGCASVVAAEAHVLAVNQLRDGEACTHVAVVDRAVSLLAAVCMSGEEAKALVGRAGATGALADLLPHPVLSREPPLLKKVLGVLGLLCTGSPSCVREFQRRGVATELEALVIGATDPGVHAAAKELTGVLETGGHEEPSCLFM